MNQTILTLLMVVLVVSCGKNADDTVDKAGNAVGKQISNFTRALGQGVDEEMMVQVEFAPALSALGLTSTTAKRLPISESKKGISVYIVASTAADVTLMAKAFNQAGVEIGRSKLPVKLEKDDAKYHIFEFDPQMDSMTAKKYSIEVLPK